MAERRRPIPDVLGEVLRPPAHQPTGTPGNPQAGKEPKDKLTTYVRRSINRRLDKAWLELRARMKAGELPELSKSILNDLALEIVLDDLEAAGMESQLVRKLRDMPSRQSS